MRRSSAPAASPAPVVRARRTTILFLYVALVFSLGVTADRLFKSFGRQWSDSLPAQQEQRAAQRAQFPHRLHNLPQTAPKPQAAS